MGNWNFDRAGESLEKVINALPETTLDFELNPTYERALLEIAKRAETNKGVFTVIVTSLLAKSLEPELDTRLHQSSMKEGYSGRTLDTKVVTPILKKHRFPSMSESGWLTRSLEQAVPFDHNFTGRITPPELKKSFLLILYYSNEVSKDTTEALTFVLKKVDELHRAPREKASAGLKVAGASPTFAMELLLDHWGSKYDDAQGTARLPVLAVYACLERFLAANSLKQTQSLAPLESHNSSDLRSKALGDVEGLNADGDKTQVVEVKFGKPITPNEIRDMKRKAMGQKLEQYIALTDGGFEAGPLMADAIREFESETGTHLVLQDTISFLETLLLFSSPIDAFLERYFELVSTDGAVKTGHVRRLKELMAETFEVKSERPAVPPKPSLLAGLKFGKRLN